MEVTVAVFIMPCLPASFEHLAKHSWGAGQYRFIWASPPADLFLCPYFKQIYFPFNYFEAWSQNHYSEQPNAD